MRALELRLVKPTGSSQGGEGAANVVAVHSSHVGVAHFGDGFHLCVRIGRVAVRGAWKVPPVWRRRTKAIRVHPRGFSMAW